MLGSDWQLIDYFKFLHQSINQLFTQNNRLFLGGKKILCIISKNVPNKSCWALHFIQKTQRVHMSISVRSGTRGSKDCHQWNIVMYWNRKVKFTLGLNAAKNTAYIVKKLQVKVFRIKFPTKNSVSAYAYLPPPTEWSQGSRKIDMVKIL